MLSVPFADGRLAFELPEGMRGTLLAGREAPVLEGWRAVHEALRDPVGSPPLRGLVKEGDHVCVVVPDATSACPDRLLVPPLVTSLELAGVAKEDITILVGVGLRRPSTPAEKEETLGTDVVQRYKVIDHDARDGAWLADLGAGPRGCPIVVNRRACEAGLLVATGIVEPDEFAGFTGGGETLALGCAGE